MKDLYIGDISALSEEAVFRKYYGRIDGFRQEKVRRCRNEEDKRRSLLAGYLLQTGIKEIKSAESGLPAEAAPLSLPYSFGVNGKPYLADYPDIYFNISHSGGYVICALSEEEIGADIQEHRGVNSKLAERFFSKEDKELLKRHSKIYGGEEDELFCRIWAVKEAHMKLTGRGMAEGLDTTSVYFDRTEGVSTRGIVKTHGPKKRDAYFRVYNNIKKYSIAVCCFSEITDINIKWITGLRELDEG